MISNKVEFSGQIDQAAAGDIINHHHVHSRELNNAEQWELKEKVSSLEKQANRQAVQIWSDLKRVLGVGLNEYRLEHKEPANRILDLQLEIATLKTDLEKSAGDLKKLEKENSQLSSKLSDVKRQANSNQAFADLTGRYNQLAVACHVLKQQYEQQKMDFAAWRAKPCTKCGIAEARLRNWRKASAAMGVLCVSFAALYGYQAWSADDTSTATTCLFAGEPYSVGSQIVVSGQQRKCAVGAGRPAVWVSDSRGIRRLRKNGGKDGRESR